MKNKLNGQPSTSEAINIRASLLKTPGTVVIMALTSGGYSAFSQDTTA